VRGKEKRERVRSVRLRDEQSKKDSADKEKRNKKSFFVHSRSMGKKGKTM
jgi:hypothetical protein